VPADYLRRKWMWAVLLLLICTAALDLGTDEMALKRLGRNPSAEAGFLDPPRVQPQRAERGRAWWA